MVFMVLISNLFHGIANSDSAKKVLVELIQYPNTLALNFIFLMNILIQRKRVAYVAT